MRTNLHEAIERHDNSVFISVWRNAITNTPIATIARVVATTDRRNRASLLAIIVVAVFIGNIRNESMNKAHAQNGGGEGTPAPTATPHWSITNTPSSPNGNNAAMDFGDAPDSLNTILLSLGASHSLNGAMLGASRDAEPDGSPSIGADGDGADEDGVVFQPAGNGNPINFPPILVPGENNTVLVTINGSNGFLSMWMDNNDNLQWDSNEKIVSDLSVLPGTSAITFFVPEIGNDSIYIRFRLVSGNITAPMLPTGHQDSGEVEDYVVRVWDVDFGDVSEFARINCVAQFPKQLIDDGARHIQRSVDKEDEPKIAGKESDLTDGERDALQSSDQFKSDGDDLVLIDDEEGVEILTKEFATCSPTTIRIRTQGSGRLMVWADLNLDCEWDAETELIRDIELPVETNGIDGVTCSFGSCQIDTVVEVGDEDDCESEGPSVEFFGSLNLRARFGDGYTTFTGLALTGEVEDHSFPVFIRDYVGCPTVGGNLPVLMLHGFQPGAIAPSGGADCSQQFSVLTNDFSGYGWTTPMRWVKYYSGDFNCHDNALIHPISNPVLPDPNEVTLNTPIQDIARALAWYIHDEFNANPTSMTSVDVAAHSLGGLLIRFAIMTVAFKNQHPLDSNPSRSGFPSSIDVSQVFTAGTPHKGIQFSDNLKTTLMPLCFSEPLKEFVLQCQQLNETSDFFFMLNSPVFGNLASNPQGSGSGGTQWTVVGSSHDSIIHMTSAVGLTGAAHRAWYDGNEGERIFGLKHIKIEHTSDKTSNPKYYYFDGGCKYLQVVYANDCPLKGDTRDPNRGPRCIRNYVPSRKQPAKNLGLCLWKFQPNVNLHASKALKGFDW